MPISTRSTSRFLTSQPILTRDGQPTFGIAKKFRFLSKKNLSSDETGIFVVDADTAGRPDSLANRLYGDPNLHWIAIIYNRVDNPLAWPILGQVIEYPLPGVVSAEI